MGKLLRRSILALAVTGLIAASAQAVTIEVIPSATTLLPGDALTVDLKISALGDGVAPSVGAFDLALGYDGGVLSFNSATFGDPDPLLGDQLDLFMLGLNFLGATPSAGSVNLFEVSLDFAQDLADFQEPMFILASLDFTAVGVGTSPLTLSNVVISDELGNSLSADVVNSSVNVIPEPGTMILLGSGLAGLAYRRRRKVGQQS